MTTAVIVANVSACIMIAAVMIGFVIGLCRGLQEYMLEQRRREHPLARGAAALRQLTEAAKTLATIQKTDRRKVYEAEEDAEQERWAEQWEAGQLTGQAWFELHRTGMLDPWMTKNDPLWEIHTVERTKRAAKRAEAAAEEAAYENRRRPQRPIISMPVPPHR